MLTADTNVVIRFLTGDDPAQQQVARQIFRDNQVRLLSTVLLETEWVLRSTYRYPRTDVHAALSSLSRLTNTHLDEPGRVALALDWFEQGMDFADALHLAAGTDAQTFVTFDRKLATLSEKLAATPVRLL